jgi:hypothetical protein
LIQELRESDVQLSLARVTTQLRECLERNGIVRLLGPERFHESVRAGVSRFLGRDGEDADGVASSSARDDGPLERA